MEGFVRYVGAGSLGLANQGWKDSGDAVRFADGRYADGAIALCEVQGYAYEAAVSGAALLDGFDRPGGDALADLGARPRRNGSGRRSGAAPRRGPWWTTPTRRSRSTAPARGSTP